MPEPGSPADEAALSALKAEWDERKQLLDKQQAQVEIYKRRAAIKEFIRTFCTGALQLMVGLFLLFLLLAWWNGWLVFSDPLHRKAPAANSIEIKLINPKK